MGMRALASAVLMLLQAVPAALPPAGSLEVDARAGHVSVRAHRVPLNRILDRLARETGMKVTYEAAPPSQPVTATFDHLEPRDAVIRLMEGLGVPYVFRTDVSGRRVDTLIVSDSGSGTNRASSGSGNMGGDNLEYPADVVEDVATYEEPPPAEMPQVMPEVQMPQIPPGMPAPDLALPGYGTNQPPGFPNGQPGYPNGQPNYPSPVSNPYPN
jgi:hypothetical protein